MPAAVLIPLIAAGAGATGSIVAAKMQSGAAEDAANLTSAAATHAADVQKQSSDAALAFQKQQAAQDLANAQAAGYGNYQQWAARQGRLSTLGQMVGLKPFQIPTYVPIQSVPASNAAPTSGKPAGYVNPNVTTMGAALRLPQ